MLAQKYEPKRLTFPLFTQPKLDGVRALYQAGRFYSRDEILWPESVLAHLANELSSLINPAYHPLDGELYLHGLSLQQINSAVAINSNGPGDKTHLIQYHVFDVVNFKKPFWSRYEEVYSLLHTTQSKSKIRAVPTRLITTLGEADEFYLDDLSHGYEGSMYRLDNVPYTRPKQGATQDNRTFSLLKRKEWHDDWFPVMGVIEGRDTDKGGKYLGGLGALVLGLPDGRNFRVGSGFSDAQRKEWFPLGPIGKQAHIKYRILSDEGIPTHTSFIELK